MPDDPISLDGLFRDHPGATLEPPWEPFWSCNSFATDNCHGVCETCADRDDEMELIA